MESKTYVFGENGNNGMMSLLAPLMQKSVRRTLNALSVVSASQRTTSTSRNKSATIRCRTMFDKMHNINTF